MIMSFTGSQRGMSGAQARSFTTLVQELRPKAFRMGDCIGADATAHGIIRAVVPTCFTVAHPPDDDSRRAWCVTDLTEEPKPYLERDDDLARGGDLLAATPAEFEEVLRSGTWATIRRALTAGTPVTVIWRCGCIQEGYERGGTHEHGSNGNGGADQNRSG